MDLIEQHDDTVPALAAAAPEAGGPALGRPARVAVPVRFGESADADVEQLRILRDLTGRTVRVHWSMIGRPLFDPRTYVHLVPPGEGSDPVVRRWAGEYRYGTFYYRQGPDFVVVKDVRPGGDHARFTVEGDDAEQFRRLAGESTLADLSPASLAALDDAVGMGLAIRGEQRFLLLPYRLRRWPVPYQAI
jgi:hypothetical protein